MAKSWRGVMEQWGQSRLCVRLPTSLPAALFMFLQSVSEKSALEDSDPLPPSSLA